MWNNDINFRLNGRNNNYNLIVIHRDFLIDHRYNQDNGINIIHSVHDIIHSSYKEEK